MVELVLDGGDGEELEFVGGGAESGEEAIGDQNFPVTKTKTLRLLSLNHSIILRRTITKRRKNRA